MTEDETAIRQVVETWMAASRKGDLETVLGLMTDDVVFMVPGKEPFGKEAFAAASRGMGETKIDGVSEIVELKLLGGWAYIRNRIDMTATPPGGEPARRSGYTLTLLRKEGDGRWRLARDANLLATQE
ncbi:SgcJ/EcaC family oxidoreductase [Mesorhizobium australafricanum]|uniref:SgcJ/EcaC family oxidoreductase n=1 Tax=Mesorhizobium australafricanum TaxID=3072311 RepID=A0ABU4WWV7_9HYPH|nr:SgcJ/EcaC family oxidoreductase [Mesorhizobium sp. VK3E]MDX8440552.1 SgcJ/EcaC family oxidoreductase [Mesorhizobium sp. VK3E]